MQLHFFVMVLLLDENTHSHGTAEACIGRESIAMLLLRLHAQGGRSEGLGLSSYAVPLSQVYALNFLELISVIRSYLDLTRQISDIWT
jgi:hypothetical protein